MSGEDYVDRLLKREAALLRRVMRQMEVIKRLREAVEKQHDAIDKLLGVLSELDAVRPPQPWEGQIFQALRAGREALKFLGAAPAEQLGEAATPSAAPRVEQKSRRPSPSRPSRYDAE